MANSDRGVVDRVTVDLVTQMFPGARRANVETYLPAVLEGLVEAGLADRPMVLMALATIRAETAGFAPLSEFQSKWNTSPGGHPFDLYDDRTVLGNRGAPDGERFRGRGFIQLTGRANYESIGAKLGLGEQLVEDPELANDAKVAARILAAFLAGKQEKIRQALAAGDFKTARKAVNGGSHGLDAFQECYQTGDRLLA